MAQKIVDKINWENTPSIRTPINEDNLNQMDSELDELDDRVVNLMGYEERVSESEVNAKKSEDLAKSWAVGGTGEREGEDTNSSKSWANKAKDYANAASNSAIASETARDLAQKYRDEAFSATPENYEATLHNAESAYKALFETSSQKTRVYYNHASSYYCDYSTLVKPKGVFKISCTTIVSASNSGENSVNVTVKNGNNEIVFNDDYQLVSNYIKLTFDIYTPEDEDIYNFVITADGTASYFTFNNIEVTLESISRNNLDLKDYLIAEGVTELLPETENPLPTFSGKTFMINRELIEKNKKYYCGFSWELIKNDGTLPVISATIGIYYKDALKNEIQKYFGSTKNGIALFDFSVEDKDINYILLIITGAGSYKISDLFVNDYGKYNTQIVGEKKILERINTIDEKQDLQNVRLSSGTELSLDTYPSKLKLEIEGGQHKSANLFDINSWNNHVLNTSGIERYGVVVKLDKVGRVYFKYSITTDNLVWAVFDKDGNVVKSTTQLINGISSTYYDNQTVGNEIHIFHANDVKNNITYFMVSYEDIPYEPFGLRVAGDMGLVDLASLSWETASSYKKALLSTAKKPSSNDTVANLISDYNVVARNKADNTNDICLDTNGYLLVRTAETPSGYLAYEVADGATPSQYCEVIKERGKNIELIEGYELRIDYEDVYPNPLWLVTDYISVLGNYHYEGFSSKSIFCYNANKSFLGRTTDGSLIDGTVFIRLNSVISGYNPIAYENSKTVFVPLSQPLAEGDSISEKGEYHEKKIIDLSSIDIPEGTLNGAPYYFIVLNDAKSVANTDIANAVSDKYPIVSRNDLYNNTTSSGLAINVMVL